MASINECIHMKLIHAFTSNLKDYREIREDEQLHHTILYTGNYLSMPLCQ